MLLPRVYPVETQLLAAKSTIFLVAANFSVLDYFETPKDPIAREVEANLLRFSPIDAL